MARYKDPEERLEDIEDMVRHIKKKVDAIQRRSTLGTFWMILRYLFILVVALWLYYQIQPVIEQVTQTTSQAQENIESVNDSFNFFRDFLGLNSDEVNTAE
jgi:cytoskeletal protein RodZ